MKDFLTKLLKGTSLLILLGILTIIILLIALLGKCVGSNDDMPAIEVTPSEIMSIMPQNELYVATAVIEDFTTRHETEYHLSLFPEKHSCVQILRQKVSYKIDLSKVTYTLLDSKTMEVMMPEPEYTASTQSSQFISDDEGYWKKALPSTNVLRYKVEQQIRSQFDTQENRQQAKLYAQEALTHVLAQLGYEAKFRSKTLPASRGEKKRN